MALELVTIPCLSDNYAFLLHDTGTGDTALIDIPAAGPILAELARRGWTLSDVWITHHHDDHVQGLGEVLAAHPARVTGAAADAHRLPPLDVQVADGDTLEFAGNTVAVMDVSGHTVGHVAYYIPAANTVFTADSLMALGCGRLFEGTAEQMWGSLTKLMALPADTLVCSGHEYTAGNAKFALTIDPDNPELISRNEQITVARATGVPTVPSTLALERATNPFLRASDPGIRSRLGMTDASDAGVFAEIRARKDAF
ncbi:hydroxyacylglutathione hydrolase [uncultured Roseobacter sp.]|uniref:hydroxyacylglutathione hydrolase n=1 Tax=uncultured Roseobacter sp. TaxID=114847 RepID=UPI0026254F28|nr:hydroxyacylglutathione hydrolase [uncultured Roseobacter sp.]